MALNSNQLYEDLSEILGPLVEYLGSLSLEEARMCILYTILCSSRVLPTIDALGTLERAKYLYLNTIEPKPDEQLPSFII